MYTNSSEGFLGFNSPDSNAHILWCQGKRKFWVSTQVLWFLHVSGRPAWPYESVIRESSDWTPSLLLWVRKALCQALSRPVTQSSCMLFLQLSFSLWRRRPAWTLYPQVQREPLALTACSSQPSFLLWSQEPQMMAELSCHLPSISLLYSLFSSLFRGSRDSFHCINSFSPKYKVLPKNRYILLRMAN